MLNAPFVTVATTVAWFGASRSRFGPAVPFEFAAASVWHVPHPAEPKTDAPALASPISCSVAGGLTIGPVVVVGGFGFPVGFVAIFVPSVKTTRRSPSADAPNAEFGSILLVMSTATYCLPRTL